MSCDERVCPDYRPHLLVKGHEPSTEQKEAAKKIADNWEGIAHLSSYEVDMLAEEISWALHEQAVIFEQRMAIRLEKLGIDVRKLTRPEDVK